MGKIDNLNKNNKNPIRIKNSMVKNNSIGSKTNKPNAPNVKDKVIPKRRGRRPKKILNNETESIMRSANKTSKKSIRAGDDDKSSVILRLNINPEKLNMKLKKRENTVNESKIKLPSIKKKPVVGKKLKHKHAHAKKTNKENSDSDSECSSDGMFKNDIPTDASCQKCDKNEAMIQMLKTKLDKYENKDRMDKTNKIYKNTINFISSTTGKKIHLKKTNIRCWWDCEKFNNLPFPLPELYYKNTYHVYGYFCSIECSFAYNLYYLKDSKIHQRKALAYNLYREMYGINYENMINIKTAPPREILEYFGGTVSIENYRKMFTKINKEYIIYMPPIKPITVIVEERNIVSGDKDNGEKYVLKRSKPLAKKRSVISSMKIKIKEEDDD